MSVVDLKKHFMYRQVTDISKQFFHLPLKLLIKYPQQQSSEHLHSGAALWCPEQSLTA